MPPCSAVSLPTIYFRFLSAANMTPLERQALKMAAKCSNWRCGTKGASMFIAGDLSLADLYLAPITFYVSLTSDKDAVFDIPGFAEWWAKVQALPSYINTQPNLG